MSRSVVLFHQQLGCIESVPSPLTRHDEHGTVKKNNKLLSMPSPEIATAPRTVVDLERATCRSSSSYR